MDLSSFDNSWFKARQNKLKNIVWYLVNALFFNSYLLPISSIKVLILRIFGAKIGQSVVLKPNINIKYPWNVEIGDYSWIGEGVWIDSLDKIQISKNVCISQAAYLLTGNHNYTSTKFDLLIAPIVLEEGVWIGAKSVVIPGTIARKNSILSVGSISPKIMEESTIYRGNPAVAVKQRVIKA
jgi:putative colanic acid biosynthesis acetyltransferase WcaF